MKLFGLDATLESSELAMASMRGDVDEEENDGHFLRYAVAWLKIEYYATLECYNSEFSVRYKTPFMIYESKRDALLMRYPRKDYRLTEPVDTTWTTQKIIDDLPPSALGLLLKQIIWQAAPSMRGLPGVRDVIKELELSTRKEGVFYAKRSKPQITFELAKLFSDHTLQLDYVIERLAIAGIRCEPQNPGLIESKIQGVMEQLEKAGIVEIDYMSGDTA